MYILSEYEQMEKKRLEYSSLYKQLEEAINGFIRVATDINIPWEGDANKAYITRLKSDTQWLSSVLYRINEAGELLQIAVSEYQKSERDIEQIIGEVGI